MPRSRYGADSDVPERRDVYEQLADDLRTAIADGQYQPGDRLPSTLELMARTGVANLTVRGAYRVLVEEGLVESVSKKGFYVRLAQRDDLADEPRPRPATPRHGGGGRMGGQRRGRGAAAPRGDQRRDRGRLRARARHVGRDRLGLPAGSRVLVRRAVRLTGPADESGLETPDSLADTYYPYDLVHDTPLASRGAASPAEILAGLGCPLRGCDDELRPRLATARGAPAVAPGGSLRGPGTGPHRPNH